MKGLALSGGSTKIAGIAGAALVVCEEHGYRPDYITGISAGSILSVPLALGMYDVIRDVTLNLKTSDVFDNPPLGKNGIPTLKGIWRLIRGKQSLGTQKNLIKTIKKFVTPEKFEEYKNGDYPQIFLGAVEFKTGEIHYFDVKKGTYEQYLKAVDASSSIPIFVESVRFDGVTLDSGVTLAKGNWMDGGARDHVGSHWLMKNFDDITEHISVYSRSKDGDIPDEDGWKPGGVLKMLKRSLDILNIEKSKNDEFIENYMAKKKGIKTRQIFMNIAQEIDYEMDPVILRQWFDEGACQAKMVMNDDWRQPEDIKLDFNGMELELS